VEAAAAATPIQEGGFHGFALTLGRKDGSKRPAYAGSLGRRVGSDLRVILVIGDSHETVDATARQVARQQRKS
jgi:hypothetical protein